MEGLIVIQYGVIWCKTVAVSFFFDKFLIFYVFQLFTFILRKVVEILIQDSFYGYNLNAKANAIRIQ